ncbi:MAG: hypothetical protein ACLQO1_12985 [Steroidobacteraceae bacterium]
MKVPAPLVVCLCLGVVAACGRSSPLPDDAPAKTAPPAPAASAGRPADGLVLSPQDMTNLGIVVMPAAAAQHVRQIDGFGIVVGRDAVVQALTDIVAARAAARQSHAALARMQRLAGTAGADSATARETAERQTVADDAALDLAEAKASSALGQRSPWASGTGQPLIQSLAAGRIKIIRISFPLGAFKTGAPLDLRLTRLDGQASDSTWRIPAIWAAPGDVSMPGRSYFAVVENSDLNDGERLLISAADTSSPAVQSGVFIPASALVVSGENYWCYTQRQSGAFARVAVDVSRPQAGGYFVADGIKPGDPVVTSGAGLLLAREMNSTGDTDP